MRKDPTLANYKATVNKFMEKANLNPKKNYLLIQSFSCHGYHNAGFQEVPSNEYDPEKKGYVMIPVEMLTRKSVTGVPNVFCLILFACCREIKKLSDQDLENIKKEF